MGVNRGKDFEAVIKKSFGNVADTHVVRLHDQTTGYKGSKNPCDFIVYHYPYQYLIECKTTNIDVLGFRYITRYQWSSLLEASETPGVVAGVLCWWVKRDVTRFIPIRLLERMAKEGMKSYKYNFEGYSGNHSILIPGHKKRVFFDYEMKEFFDSIKYPYKQD